MLHLHFHHQTESMKSLLAGLIGFSVATAYNVYKIVYLNIQLKVNMANILSLDFLDDAATTLLLGAIGALGGYLMRLIIKTLKKYFE